MKKLLPILFILLAAVTARADLVTATIVITNAPTVNGATLTVNGNTRTWTNNVVNAATQIGTNATIGGSATNMFNQIAGARFSGVELTRSGTNGVVLYGLNMTATVSAGYATVTLVTNTLTGIRNVEVPFSSAYSATGRVGIASLLITGLENTTTAFETNSPALTNHVGIYTDQTITGAKTFTGANTHSNASQVWSGGTITNAVLSNCVPALTNGYASDLVLTNGQNYGAPFRSPGLGTGSEQFGISALASNDFCIAIGDGSIATGNGSVVVGWSGQAFNGAATAVGGAANAGAGLSTAIGSVAVATGDSSTAIGAQAQATMARSVALGWGAQSYHADSVAIGGATTTADHQIRLGTSSEYVSIPGNLSVDGSFLNSAFAGSVTLNNELILTSFNNTSLATNNSAVNISTNSYVTIATGPSAAFAIHGIAGGVAGRVVTIENTTGQSMVFVNNSGVDANSDNRIYTGTGAEILNTNNPGVVSFRYNGTLSKWVITGHN